jgi:hypothetical protein
MTGLLVVAAVIAILPASAGAAISPTLTLNQSAGDTAGSSPATGFDINTHSTIDSIRNLTFNFPAGFWLNLDTDGGACLASSAPTPLCEIGSGIATPLNAVVTFYLVAPPSLSYVAGIAMTIAGKTTTTVTGGLSLVTAPAPALSLTFDDIEEGITDLSFTLSNTRLPSSCTAVPLVSLQMTGWGGTTGAAAAPMTLAGCGALTFAPTIAATVTKQPGGATVQVAIKFAAGDSAPTAIAFGNPTGVKINKVLAPCFKGITCTVGAVSAESPLLPATALNTGTLALAGQINAGTLSQQITGSLTMSFPPPYQLSIVGPINLQEKTLTFLSMPDIPLSTLAFTFTGTPEGPAFTTACDAGTIAASLVPQDGNPPVKISGPVTNVNCPPPSAKPKASASISGLVNGHPKLVVHVAHAPGGPDITSLRIAAPSGMAFSHQGLTCTGGHCSAKGLSGSLKRVRLVNGALQITFSHAVASTTLVIRGPLLVESSALERKLKKNIVPPLAVHLRITFANGHTTTLAAK